MGQTYWPTIFSGQAAPLRGAEDQAACAISAYAQYACLLSLQMGSFNWTRIQARRPPKFVYEPSARWFEMGPQREARLIFEKKSRSAWQESLTQAYTERRARQSLELKGGQALRARAGCSSGMLAQLLPRGGRDVVDVGHGALARVAAGQLLDDRGHHEQSLRGQHPEVVLW